MDLRFLKKVCGFKLLFSLMVLSFFGKCVFVWGFIMVIINVKFV